jgi:RimJ/RimL family protein N-acetyltransferase
VARLICLHDKSAVEAFARSNPGLHLYEIGDLDDFFWPHTIWYALEEAGRVRQLALLYTESRLPTLLAFADEPVSLMRELLSALRPLLPRKFYAHLDLRAADVLASGWNMDCHGAFYKMGLTERTRLPDFDTSATVALTSADLPELEDLYAAAYPRNFFMPRMLETGYYFGVRRGDKLASVAGIHVYSQRYSAAALGNITTRPEARGQGLATTVTARLCQELARAGIAHIGLNVRADNQSAVACYEKIGFRRVADYGEYTLEAK